MLWYGNLELWKCPYISLSLSPNILVYPSTANPDAPPLLSQSDLFPTQYCVNVTPPSGTDIQRLVSALLFRVEDIGVTPRNYSYFWIVSDVLMYYISLSHLVCSSKCSMHTWMYYIMYWCFLTSFAAWAQTKSREFCEQSGECFFCCCHTSRPLSVLTSYHHQSLRRQATQLNS